jgi:hypothetical protein
MTEHSNGTTASYYELPLVAKELQDLISFRNMNAQDGEIFRTIYRKGRASHSDALRDARKVLFYAQAEVNRLEQLEIGMNEPQPTVSRQELFRQSQALYDQAVRMYFASTEAPDLVVPLKDLP